MKKAKDIFLTILLSQLAIFSWVTLYSILHNIGHISDSELVELLICIPFTAAVSYWLVVRCVYLHRTYFALGRS